MRIDCVSDLHGYLPNLKGGDVLVIAGDMTATDSPEDWELFFNWLIALDYKHTIFIAGNHDNGLSSTTPMVSARGGHYLIDSGCEIEGVKFWGSPWTKSFVGMNPVCKAFTLETDELLKAKWDLIPDDTDVLITHSPPKGILDKEQRNHYRCGSPALLDRVKELKFKAHIFGHIHESRGILEMDDKKFVNCSYVGRSYKVHKEDEVISIII